MGGRVWLSALCLGIFLSTGCGSSGSSTTAQLRFFQASPDAPHVNVLVDGASVATNLGYGNGTGYISVKSGSRHIQIVPLSGSSPILDESLSISSGANQTLLLTGPAASIKPVVLTDGGTKVTTGMDTCAWSMLRAPWDLPMCTLLLQELSSRDSSPS